MMLGAGGNVTGDILNRIPNDSIGAEIGVWEGKSSKKFLTKAKHLYMIDPWSIFSYKLSYKENQKDFSHFLKKYRELSETDDLEDYQIFYDTIYRKVCSEFIDQPVTIYRMTSDDWFKFFNRKIDWIYVDGNHNYKSCLKDLENSSKITSIIFGDDYGVKGGVTKAVDYFEDSYDCIVTKFDFYQYEIRMLK
jgi:hypothetical protein